MFRRFKQPILFLAALLFITVPAYGYIAYDVPAPSTGNQFWDGALGMDFDVNFPISVTAMGVYDSNQDGISGTVTAVIYDRNTQQQVANTLTSFTGSAGSLINGSRFQNLASTVTLGLGQYSMVAWGYSNFEPNGNWNIDNSYLSTENNGGGLISFVGTSRWDNATNSYPTITASGLPTNCFYAGTFQYVAPVPGAVWLLGSGLAGLMVMRRSRKS